jgi:glycine/D-amino acid oxidase-like deaminating enzyme
VPPEPWYTRSKAIATVRIMKLRTSSPLWLAQQPARPQRYPPLRRDIIADVAIVGGGMTGATVAWLFATRGLRVALVEASLVGRGSTAASTALLLQEPDEALGNLAKRYGRARARRIWEVSRAAVRDLTSALSELRVVCDLVFRDTIYYSTRTAAIRSLRREFQRRQAAGFLGGWLDASALRKATGVVGECGIRTTGNAQIDPYRACLGLMKAARNAGAHVFEQSAVRAVETESAGVRVRTAKGSVSAAHVIVATGYATQEFKPLAGRFQMKHTYVLATEPLHANEREKRGLEDVMLWDVERPYHYVRWTRDHRLLLGGGDTRRVSESRRRKLFPARTRALHRHFERIMPGVQGVAIDYRWEGLFAMTSDGLPYVGPHPRYPRHLFALGYGGNGMSLGIVAARLLWEMIQGHSSADHAIFAFDRFQSRVR